MQIAGKAAARPAVLKDISEIGLCCQFDQRVDEMTLVAIDLELPGNPGTHRVRGAVVRCDPVRQPQGSYEVAVYFTEISPATRQALGGLVGKGTPA